MRWRSAWLTRDAGAAALVAAAYASLRLYAFLGQPTQTARDTVTYIGVSAQWSPLDPAFYGARRPFVIPLFYELAGSQTAWAWGQWVIATAAWVLLAVVVASGISNRWLRAAAFAAILVLSLARPVTVWDRILLSESLSMSIGALLLAALALLLRRTTRVRVAWAVLALVLLAFVRDANAPVGALLFLVVAAALFVTGRRPLACALAAVSIAVLLASQLSVDAGRRWEHPVMNVVGRRVLPDPEMRDYFVHRGMPYDDSVRRLAGYSVSQDDYAFLKNRPLSDWVRAHGRSVYLSFLLTHPRYVASSPASDQRLLAQPDRIDYPAASSTPVLPKPIESAVYPAGRVGSILVVALALVLTAAFIRDRKREWLVPAAVLASTPLHLAFVWHADAIEVGRHAVFANVALRVAAVWLLILGVDAALARRRGVNGEGGIRTRDGA